jgi:sugar phosphate isomerase/epimerase
MNRREFVRNTVVAGVALKSAMAGPLAQPAPQDTGDTNGLMYVMFSKKLKEQSVEQLIESLKFVGADGVDLAVRPGYPVNPDNVGQALVPAADRLRAAGLSILMVTAPTDLTNASAPYTEPLFRACGEAKVPLIKLGYWGAPAEDYWGAVQQMNADLGQFADLGAKYGVKPCLHTHSGNNMALNAAALMHILRDFPPDRAGAYVDVGHLAVCGEPPALAFAMAAEWLSIVGCKDLDRVKTDDGATKTRTVPIGEGFVDWRQVVNWLVKHDFKGPLTFHSEFPSPNAEHLLEQTKKDIAFIRDLERHARVAR